MKTFAFLLSFLLAGTAVLAQTDQRTFELRIYYCEPGRLDALIQRFTNHTTRIFEKHGMTNVGYWLPTNNTDNALYYVLAYPSRAARDSSWKAFSADPEWKQVQSKSEESGKIVNHVTSIFMNATAFSPAIKPSVKNPERVFELRTYTCLPGQLPKLLTRFNDHTCKLFEQHGFTNIAYWKTVEKDTAQPKLIYILAHPNEETATKNWAAFRADPKWIAVRDASEKDGKILEKYESVYLKPLPFSTIK